MKNFEKFIWGSFFFKFFCGGPCGVGHVHFSFARPKEKRTKEKGRRLHLRFSSRLSEEAGTLLEIREQRVEIREQRLEFREQRLEIREQRLESRVWRVAFIELVCLRVWSFESLAFREFDFSFI
jgi:hypothetical protein